MIRSGVHPRTTYDMECWRTSVLIWSERFHNLVTTVGMNQILDATFKTGLAAPAWYVALVNNANFTAYAASDTMASHVGWIEGTPYSQGTRPAFTPGAIAAGSVDNSASKAVFTINATLTIRGAFLVDVSTKGGNTGTLYGVGNLVNTRTVYSGDTLNITTTISVN